MKKLLTIVAIIVLVAIGGVISVPLLIDDEGLKQKFTENLQMMTGRNVSVDGDFSLKFMPSPTITAERTRIANVTGTTNPNMLEIEKITAELDLKSLISGNLRITRTELIKPKVYIDVLPDGKVNWTLDFLNSNGTDANAGNMPDEVSFDSLTIQDGSIIFTNKASNVEYNLEQLNGEMIAETLRGPYRFDGTFKLFDAATGLAISLDKLHTREPSELNVMFSRPDTGASIAISGKLIHSTPSFSFAGNVVADIANPDKLISFWIPNVKVPDNLTTPITANLSLKMQGTQVSLADIVIKQGENSAVGDASFALYAPETNNKEDKNLRANFIISYLELSPWVDLIKNICQSETEGNISFVNNALIALKADILKYNDGNIEDTAMLIDSSENTVTFSNIKAKLPGTALLQGNLTLTKAAEEKDLNLAGDFNISAEKTAELLKWLALPLPAEITDRIPPDNSTFKAELALNPNSFYLDKIVFKAGSISVDGKIGTDLALQEDNFDLDLQIAGINIKESLNKTTIQDNIKNISEKGINAGIQDIFKAFPFINKYNARIKLDISESAYGQISSPRIVFNGSIKDGIANVTEFRMNNIAGNSASLRGEVSGLEEGKPLVLKNLEVNLKLSRVNQIINDMGIALPFDTAKMTNLLLDATLNGSEEKILFKLVGDTSGAYFNAEGTYEEATAEKPSSTVFTFEIRHPQTRNLISLFSSYKLPQEITGKFKFFGNFDVTKGQTKITGLELNIGADKITGNAGISEKNDRKVFIASLETDKFYVNNYFATKTMAAFPATAPEWDKEPFALTEFLKTLTAQINLSAKTLVAGTTNFNDALVKIKVLNKVAELTSLEAKMGEEGTVNIKGMLDLRPDFPLFTAEANGTKVKVNSLFDAKDKVNLSAEMADFKVRMTGKGNSVYEMVSGMGGSGTFTFANGEIAGLSLTKAQDFLQKTFDDGEEESATFLSSFRQALQNNNTPFNSLTGTFNINNGQITAAPLDLLYNKDKKSFVAFKLDLTTSDLNTTVKVPEDTMLNIPAYSVIIKGTLDAPIYTFADTELEKQLQSEAKAKEEQIKEEALEKAKIQETEALKQEQDFTEKLEALKKEVGDTYQKVLTTEKMAEITPSIKNIAAENRMLAEKMLLDFSPLVDFVGKENITDAEIKLIAGITEKVQEPIDKINANYAKVLTISAKATAKKYAQDAAKFVKYARDMEKANPFAPIISDAAKKIDDAGYEAENASRLAEEAADAKQAEAAVLRAKKAFDKAKEEVGRIVKFTGSTEGLE